MTSELTQLTNAFLSPFIFIVMCLIVYLFIAAILFYRILRIPDPFSKMLIGVGMLGAFMWIASEFNTISKLVEGISSIVMIIALMVLLVVVALLGALISGNKKKTRATGKAKAGSRSSNHKRKQSIRRTGTRSDDIILRSPLHDLSGSEFERLLALYFRDQGYQVEEVGVGGNDGGVDLVIVDRRGERTAVQAKCYADHNTVGVSVVRELVAAKRNHNCILSLLITTSDLTQAAKKEAEQFKVDYWHGALLEQKLRAWDKWQPEGKKKPTQSVSVTSKAKSEVAAAKASSLPTCSKCGAPMVLRKSKEGKQFYGCSAFPACRNTSAL